MRNRRLFLRQVKRHLSHDGFSAHKGEIAWEVRCGACDEYAAFPRYPMDQIELNVRCAACGTPNVVPGTTLLEGKTLPVECRCGHVIPITVGTEATPGRRPRARPAT